MQDKISKEIRAMLANYIDIPEEEVSMDAILDSEYEMDSTEMIEFAKKIEQKYGISITKSDHRTWLSGNHVCKFVIDQMAKLQ